MANIDCGSVGRFVSVSGVTVQIGTIEPMCTKIIFECMKCGAEQGLILNDGIYMLPNMCTSGASEAPCRGRSFQPLFDHKNVESMDSQMVKVEETLIDRSGDLPRSLKCLLTRDLCDVCRPGDQVVVSGIVCTTNPVSAISGGRKRDVGTISQFYLKVFRDRLGSSTQIQIGDDVAKGKSFWMLRVAVRSGGIFRASPDINKVRDNSHVLIVGDAGLGKSHMLQAVAKLSSRGIYVCGGTSSTCGLTVTVTRDVSQGAEGSECSLEAGSLVLSDRGICCVDEFDKMPNQHACLLEAMEQQFVSVAKDGVICSLPTRTSIVAAANPIGSQYRRTKTVAENLRIGAPLLSRFDLVFVLIDKPTKGREKELASHILRNYQASPGPSSRKPESPTLSLLRRRHQESGLNPITMRQFEALVRLTRARARCELRTVATVADAQDVLDLLKYSMIDTFSTDSGQVDFERSQHGSGLSKKKQSMKFLEELRNISQARSRLDFSEGELRELFGLLKFDKEQKWSFQELLSSLNQHGFLLLKGAKKYQLQVGGF